MGQRFFSNFDADTPGALPSGWTNTDSGDFKARTVNPVSSPNSLGDPTYHSLGITLRTGTTATTSGVQQYTQKITLNGSSQGAYCSPIFASADGQNGLLFAFDPVTGVGYPFNRVAGAYNLLGGGSVFASLAPLTNGQIQILKFEVTATKMRVKAWLQGDPEPASWALDYTHGITPGSWYFGVVETSTSVAAGTSNFDNFFIGDVGETFAQQAEAFSANFDADTVGTLPSGWTNTDSSDFKVRTVNPVSGAHSLGDPTFNSLGITLHTGGAPANAGCVQFSQVVTLNGSNQGAFCCPIFAAADGQNGLLYALNLFEGNGFPFTRTAGTYALIGATPIAFTPFSNGQVAIIKCEVTPTNLRVKVWLGGTDEPGSWTMDVAHGIITPAWYFGIVETATVTPAGTANFDDFFVGEVGSTFATETFTANPSTIKAGLQNVSITLTKTVGADWTAGTPGSPTFSVTGGTKVSQVVTSATTATVVVSTEQIGVVTISSSGSGSVNVTAEAPYSIVDTSVNGTTVRKLVPWNYDVGTPTTLIQYCHGMGEDYTSLTGDVLKQGVVNVLAAAGCLICASSLHGESIGNQQGIDDNTALLAHMQANYNINKVVLFGQSAGGPVALNFIRLGTHTQVAGAFLIYGVCNLIDFHAGAYQSYCNTAYGTDNAGFAAVSGPYDPVLNAVASYVGLYFRFYASPDDTVVSKTNNTDQMRTLLATGTPAENSLVVCSGDHGDPSHFVPLEVLAFVQRAEVPRIDASGAGVTTAPTASGTATISMTGTGAGVTTAATAAGTATQSMSGSGAGATTAPAAAGTGTQSMSGSGAGVTTSPTAAGTATQESDMAVYPDEDDVRSGVSYGPTGADFTGTFVGVEPADDPTQSRGSLRCFTQQGAADPTAKITIQQIRASSTGAWPLNLLEVDCDTDGDIVDPEDTEKGVLHARGVSYRARRGVGASDSRVEWVYYTVPDESTFELPAMLGLD